VPAPTVATTPAPAPVPTGAPDLQSRAEEVKKDQVARPSVPLTKAQKLAELNAAYKTDQITPAEYHKRRAAILAEP